MRWIIGDIHGMLRSLETLISAIERRDAQRRLLFVGDYVNRGPESKRVIDLLMSLSDAQFCRGNHDDVFDHVISGMTYCGKPGEEHRIAAFQWFMQHGLDKTFLSYGVREPDLSHALKKPNKASIDLLIDHVPPAHRRFLRALPGVLEFDDLFIVHAKWDCFTTTTSPSISERLETSEALRYSVLWGRYRIGEVATEKMWERPGYFGHTPVDSYSESADLLPVLGPKMTLLDTAVALLPHGRLTAWCHESGEFLQTDPAGKLVSGS